MNAAVSILLLEDEPLILMDLEFAGEDRGCAVVSATNCGEALELIKSGHAVDVAVLDVSLLGGQTCIPVARHLEKLGVPFLLHSGDLDRHDERIRDLDAPLIAKPASAEKVIAAAIVLAQGEGPANLKMAAE